MAARDGIAARGAAEREPGTRMVGMSDQTGQASALAKGLAVLEVVLSNDRLSDLAKATGLSNSTVHRILSELVANGWVYQDDAKRYRPGRRMLALAGLLSDDAEINRQARPHLEALREATGATVHFGLVKHDAVMYAAKLDGRGSYRMVSRVGGLVPLHSTSIGKSVLAARSDQEVAEIMHRTGMRGVTEATHTTVASLLEDLRATRQRGWAIDNGENEANLRCIGAAVLDSSGRAIGGVSISALEFELPISRLREVSEQVMRAARGISASLGYTGEARDDAR